MKIAVTGSAGFIGSNLVDACLACEWDVVGIDNLSTGFDDMADPIRVAHLPGHYMFAKMDINDTDLLAQRFDNCEVVFHLAALPRVSFSIDHPLEADYANVHGTLSVLEAARKAGVKRVVFSSSSSVYGGMCDFPTKEDSIPHPMSPYALHKLTCEHYMRLYSKLHGLDTVCLRYFNVTGQYQRAGSAYATLIPILMEKAIKDEVCIINGDGEISRDFCPVENVVQANLLAANYSDKLDGAIFNVACGKYTTINEVYDRICKLAGKTIQKRHGPYRLGDPLKSLADITKSQTVLGYKPVITLDESLQKTWAWWKERYHI